MASENPNPYSPPSTDSDRDLSSALDAGLKTRERAVFSTVITEADLLDALDCKSYRRDLRKLRRLRVLVLAPVLLILLAEFAQGLGVARLRLMPLVMLGGLSCLLAFTGFMHWRLRRKSVKINQPLLGAVNGWLDRSGLWIESEHQTRYRPLDQLVGAAKTRHALVLCFDRAYALFETLPFRAFEDVDTAELLADRLVESRPFQSAASMDSRRLEPLQGEPKFQAQADATYYSGQVMLADLKGTSMERSQRWARFWGWFQTLVILCCSAGFVLFISPSILLTFASVAVLTFVFLRTTLRILRVPFLGQAERGVMFYSSGWLDQNGLVALTRIGQANTRWAAFDTVEFTDDLIALRSRDADLWHLVSRSQFADQRDWQAAVAVAKRSMGSKGR
ncbi:MAG: hypothetical protein ACR2NZ_22220 [Rubripirellula sp.]